LVRLQVNPEVLMSRRIPVAVVFAFLLGALALTLACTNKKVSNPLANVGSKQPDKVLFDRAMEALKHNRFDVARLTLQTLINTYPDSEFIARAKLGVADSWYAEGGTAALSQAEVEYNDFKTFFPNMPEAAEAQLKIANIHYQQMEKPDRDYTHALRAQEEYRNLILQFPDSKLVGAAKQRLLEVQEVLAEREFRVGRFYNLRMSYPAAIARLQSVVDQYPLYSRADEALYELGQSYESEIALVRAHPDCGSNGLPRGCVSEASKAHLIGDLTKHAAEAYSHILTRYPLMTRADDATARLTALHQPVPRPTKAAVARNKAEEDSRRESGMMTKVLRNFSKHPDVAQAVRVGEPPLVDPKPMSATEVFRQTTQALAANSGATSDKSGVSIETIGTGKAGPNQPAPRSDAPPAGAGADPSAEQPATQPTGDELTPNVPADSNPTNPPTASDPNELKPNVSGDGNAPLPPPQQVNEIQAGGATSPDGNGNAIAGDAKPADAAASGQQPANDADLSSSKHKKKKGLKKVVPF
jgi:outer membrane protein assembly factor BamD